MERQGDHYQQQHRLPPKKRSFDHTNTTTTDSGGVVEAVAAEEVVTIATTARAAEAYESNRWDDDGASYGRVWPQEREARGEAHSVSVSEPAGDDDDRKMGMSQPFSLVHFGSQKRGTPAIYRRLDPTSLSDRTALREAFPSFDGPRQLPLGEYHLSSANKRQKAMVQFMECVSPILPPVTTTTTTTRQQKSTSWMMGKNNKGHSWSTSAPRSVGTKTVTFSIPSWTPKPTTQWRERTPVLASSVLRPTNEREQHVLFGNTYYSKSPLSTSGTTTTTTRASDEFDGAPKGSSSSSISYNCSASVPLWGRYFVSDDNSNNNHYNNNGVIEGPACNGGDDDDDHDDESYLKLQSQRQQQQQQQEQQQQKQQQQRQQQQQQQTTNTGTNDVWIEWTPTLPCVLPPPLYGSGTNGSIGSLSATPPARSEPTTTTTTLFWGGSDGQGECPLSSADLTPEHFYGILASDPLIDFQQQQQPPPVDEGISRAASDDAVAPSFRQQDGLSAAAGNKQPNADNRASLVNPMTPEDSIAADALLGLMPSVEAQRHSTVPPALAAQPARAPTLPPPHAASAVSHRPALRCIHNTDASSSRGINNSSSSSSRDHYSTPLLHRSIKRRDPALLEDVSITNKPCKCKNTYCLKLYCSCFQSKQYCDPKICKCTMCENTEMAEKENGERSRAIATILQRRSDAFDVRIRKRTGEGCSCKKDRCLRKYCDCRANNVNCSSKCSCVDCANATPPT